MNELAEADYQPEDAEEATSILAMAEDVYAEEEAEQEDQSYDDQEEDLS